MLIAAIVVLVAAQILLGWAWMRIAAYAGEERLPWLAGYPAATPWRWRIAVGIGMGLCIVGGGTLVRELDWTVWLAPIGVIVATPIWVVITARHNRAVSA